MPLSNDDILLPPVPQGLAQGNGLSGSTFTLFQNYYGSRNFNAEYITKGFGEPNAAAKGDMVEKTVQDAIP
eukprot:129543-Chlamydomonas_euryale.AAC.1